MAGGPVFDGRDPCERTGGDTCACAQDLAAALENAHAELRSAENELRERSEEIERLEKLTEQLKEAMASRATIEQAKGIIVSDTGCDADDAFRQLVGVSRNRNVKVRDLARVIVKQAQRSRLTRPGKARNTRPAETPRQVTEVKVRQHGRQRGKTS